MAGQPASMLGRLGIDEKPIASTAVGRPTFSAFPIIGVSLTSPKRDITELWEVARYNLKPRFLRIPGVARVDLVGGRTPEYHVVFGVSGRARCGRQQKQNGKAVARSVNCGA